MKKLQLPVRVSETLKKDLEELAESDNRSLSNYVRNVLKNHIADKQKSEGKNNYEIN